MYLQIWCHKLDCREIRLCCKVHLSSSWWIADRLLQVTNSGNVRLTDLHHKKESKCSSKTEGKDLLPMLYLGSRGKNPVLVTASSCHSLNTINGKQDILPKPQVTKLHMIYSMAVCVLLPVAMELRAVCSSSHSLGAFIHTSKYSNTFKAQLASLSLYQLYQGQLVHFSFTRVAHKK